MDQVGSPPPMPLIAALEQEGIMEHNNCARSVWLTTLGMRRPIAAANVPGELPESPFIPGQGYYYLLTYRLYLLGTPYLLQHLWF